MQPKISLMCRKRVTWLWVVVILFIMSGSVGCQSTITSQSASSSSHPIVDQSTAEPPRTFNVSGKPTLIVKNRIGGDVTVHAGDTHRVVITATKHANSSSDADNIHIDMKQKDNNEIDVDIYTKSGSSNNQSADLAVTLPAASDIQATAGAGTIDVDGINGQMDLTAQAGALNYKNGTLKGPSTFKTQAGSIDFTGSLEDKGTYDFQSQAGDITITLPDNASFKLDASTEVGSISNEFGSDTVGAHPTSQLHAHTSVGTVNIRKKGSADINAHFRHNL